MKLYILYFESANYCGYGEYCLVQAHSEDEAKLIASDYMENFYYEQDGEQYTEENGDDADVGAWADVKTCEEFTPEHESWQYAWKPDQASFYPHINFPENYKP